jgi:hypothetical protein
MGDGNVGAITTGRTASTRDGPPEWAAGDEGSLRALLADDDQNVEAAVALSHILLARAEYMRLAHTLFHSTEDMAPAPLPDREIFELLGFD